MNVLQKMASYTRRYFYVNITLREMRICHKTILCA